MGPHREDPFLKLREGQPKRKAQKRSDDGLSSDEEEDHILTEEASENDSDRDKFIRRIFAFLKPHIRRQKKDTPASVSTCLQPDSNSIRLPKILIQSKGLT